MSEQEVGSSVVEQLLQPLADEAEPAGPDLEYDNDFLALQQAATGRPETQFDAGSPPDWRDVREQAQALLERTRDLRIGVYWLRAMVHLEGFAALSQGLRLVHGLLENFWDTLHPLPDEGDFYARVNALAVLREQDGLLGDLRQAQLFNMRGIGEVRIRSAEIALGLLQPNEDEMPIERDRLQQMFADAVAQRPQLRDSMAGALGRTRELVTLIGERFDSQEAPDLKPLVVLLNALKSLFPAEDAPLAEEEADDRPAVDATANPGSPATVARSSGEILSRDDAVKAIEKVCAFLERTEPTNPAPLLLRRASRMINRNFLQLMKELAPESLSEVARLMGVDPDTVQIEDSV